MKQSKVVLCSEIKIKGTLLFKYIKNHIFVNTNSIKILNYNIVLYLDP